MTFVSTALAIASVLFGLGAPCALLCLPPRWRMHWPVVAPLAGVAWISLVTWIAITAGQPIAATVVWGTSAGALGLMAVAVRVERERIVRLIIGGLRRHAGVLALAILALVAIAWPATQARLGLTTVSLGSCDAPDYAAGAALMRDIPPGDLSGFNGQTETVALRSVGTFHEHWLRLNHFAPASMLAWFSVLFGLPLFKLVTALAIALHAAAVPAVFWVARSGLRLDAWSAVAVAAAWACSAPAVYGVAQVALGQIMVVPAVAWLTWAGLKAQDEGGSWRGALRWAPLAAAGFVVLIAAYTFALVFVLAPLAVALGWRAWSGRAWARLARAAASGAVALAGVALVLRERMAGLADRFSLFEAIDFGWPIPVLTPERWLGWFGDAHLAGGGVGLARVLVLATVTAWVAYALWAWRRDRRQLGTAAAWLATAAGGYSLLALKGVQEGSNELYNAYKVFALLQPLSLAAIVVPLRGAHRAGHAGRALGAFAVAGLLTVHWIGAAPVREALRRPTLWVDKPLQSIEAVAARDDVESVNMVLEPMWPRLWANSMLLGKRQYFRTETYEGRRATPLRGDWDLRDGLLGVDLGAADTIRLGGGYHLVRRAGALQPELGPGWHAPEGGGAGRWVWSAGQEAVVHIDHPCQERARVRLEFGLQGHGTRTVTVALDGGVEPAWSGTLTASITPVVIDDLLLPPGRTSLRIRSVEPATAPPGDARPLGFALHDLTIFLHERSACHE